MTTKRAAAPTEETRRARVLPLIDRAKRVASMLDRWEAEDIADEPDWDIDAVERVTLRPPSS